jgi:hypothetical protein
MCTAPLWCQVSKRIMKEECEKHGTYYNHVQRSYFNPQLWHHIIITKCHSIHHKHSKRLSITIKLTKWCYTNQNGQFYIEPCNTWVQYSWLAEPNNPSSIIWKFHCCFHITRTAYTSKYSQSKIHQQLHHYDISVLQMYTIITAPHFTHHCITLYSYCTW